MVNPNDGKLIGKRNAFGSIESYDKRSSKSRTPRNRDPIQIIECQVSLLKSLFDNRVDGDDMLPGCDLWVDAAILGMDLNLGGNDI
jgi:hypothetical protein